MYIKSLYYQMTRLLKKKEHHYPVVYAEYDTLFICRYKVTSELSFFNCHKIQGAYQNRTLQRSAGTYVNVQTDCGYSHV